MEGACMANHPTAGQFVWHDLMSTDRDAALDFYTQLFGWTIKEVDMGETIGKYPMIHAGEEGIGGAVSLDASHGVPSHWITYLSVDDVDAACERVKTIGGQVPYAPFDIPDTGRTAVVQDSTGAYFSPYKGIDPEWQPSPPRIGTFAWHELMSTDIDRATSFYVDIMGWGLRSMDMGPAGIYWLFQREETDVAGGIQMPPDAEAPSNWLPYIGVADVPATAQKAESLGGKIWVQPTKIGDPVDVHFAVLSSPDGAMFGILELPG